MDDARTSNPVALVAARGRLRRGKGERATVDSRSQDRRRQERQREGPEVARSRSRTRAGFRCRRSTTSIRSRSTSTRSASRPTTPRTATSSPRSPKPRSSRSRTARRSTSGSSSTKGRRPRSTSSPSTASIRSDRRRADIHRELKLKFKKGDVFDHAKYLEQKGAVEDQLKTLGFAWADVKGEVDVDRDAKSADLHLQGRSRAEGDHRPRLHPRLRSHRSQAHPRARRHPRRQAVRPAGARGRARAHLQPRRLLVGESGVRARPVASRARRRHHHRARRQVPRAAARRRRQLRVDALRRPPRRRSTSSTTSSAACARSSCALEPGWVFLVNPASIGAPTGGPTNGPSLKAEATFTQPDFIAPWYDFKWIVGYDVGIDYAYQYHGPRTTLGVSRPLWHNRINVGLSYNFNFLMFFNTVPAFQDGPARGVAAATATPIRIASAGCRKTSCSTCATSRSTPHKGALPRHCTLEEGGVYAGGAFTYEKVLPEARLYIPIGIARHVRHARRVRPGLRAGRRSGSPITRRFYHGRARFASRLQLQPLVAAGADRLSGRAQSADRRRSAAAAAGRAARQHRAALRQLVRHHRVPRRRRRRGAVGEREPAGGAGAVADQPRRHLRNGQMPTFSSTRAAVEAAHRGRRRPSLQDGDRDHPRRRRRARQSHRAAASPTARRIRIRTRAWRSTSRSGRASDARAENRRQGDRLDRAVGAAAGGRRRC